jgi:hypothetical protein
MDYQRIEKYINDGINAQNQMSISQRVKFFSSVANIIISQNVQDRNLITKVIDSIEGLRMYLAYNKATESVMAVIDIVLAYQNLTLARLVDDKERLIGSLRSVAYYEPNDEMRALLKAEAETLQG